MGFFLEVAFSPFSVIRFWSLLFLFQDDSKPCFVLTLSFTSVYNGTFVKLCSESQSRTGYWAQIQPLCSLVLSSAFSARPEKIIKRRPFSTKMGFCGFICGCAFNISSKFRNTLVFIQIGNYSSLFPWSVDIHLQKEVNHEITCWGAWMKCIHSASWFFLTDTSCLPVFCYAVLQQTSFAKHVFDPSLCFKYLGQIRPSNMPDSVWFFISYTNHWLLFWCWK